MYVLLLCHLDLISFHLAFFFFLTIKWHFLFVCFSIYFYYLEAVHWEDSFSFLITNVFNLLLSKVFTSTS